MIQVSSPGKLYLAGEYAILSPGSQAIAVAVDRFLTVTLTPVDTIGTLETELADSMICWRWESRQIVSAQKDTFALVFSVMDVMARYTEQYDHFQIHIISELAAKNGVKLGLGSSGAVTVALVRALGQHYGLWGADPTDQERQLLFKLAALAQHQAGYQGSYGDLATIAYTGVVRYQNFDHTYLQTMPQETGPVFQNWLNESCPTLQIERLQFPDQWEFLVAWMQEAVSTDQLIQSEVSSHKQNKAFQTLIQQSKAVIPMLVQGIQTADWERVDQALQTNAKDLMNYTETVNKPYQTSQTKQATALAHTLHASSKISGAGGGDCVIALTRDFKTATDVQTLWQAHQLIPLPLSIYTERT
ncbi:MAG: phosphomevalonate kinase [Aerococcus sp.]|nr:phosphomevalonate kinase [Aerococcus sp.]